ncbi:hypothetical protein LJB89_03920, partial [Tyzzerella sp. OttesenSCG-928-J15]|nr:hypothetical protein [Tyzzerella sp. OttesenSCG-928-J15]
MKKNRIIAMFLAALTVFNMVPFINVGMELQAAVNMVVDFDSNLTRGDGTNTPKMNNAVDNVPQDSVYVKYPLTGNGKGYTLTYLLDKTTRIDFDVRYDSGVSKATGYFRVYKYNAGAWVKDSRFSPNMYSYTANVYLGADVFIDNTPVWESNQVHKVGANPTPPSHHVPEADDGYFFEVAVNGGFSFRYGDHDIHFMVDNQQVLHYTANGIKNGNIYNFYLLDNDDDHVVSKVQAFTGIDTNSIDFIPIVSDKDTAITDQTKFGTNPLRNDNYVLNYTNGEYPAAGEPTGSTSRNANVGMAIRFNEPMVFDYASMPAVDSPTAVTSANYGPTYKQPSATDMEIEVVMEMYHNLSSPQGQLRLTVDNILALPAVNAQTPKRPSAAFSNYPLGTANEPLAKIEVNEAFDEALINSSSYASYLLDSSGNPQNPRRVQVILNNLLPGAMFDGIVVRAKTFEYRSTSPTPTVTVPKEELGVSKLRGSIGTLFGKAFTFMAYTFTYDGVKFALQFIPYKGYGGTYQVKTQSGPSYERNSNGQDFISFDLTSLLPNTYQILFMPESLSSGGINWNNAIYSEKSIYYPDQATVDLGPAQNFIIEDYRLKPKDIYDNPDEYGKTGTLDLDLSWQIGMKVAIQSMYDQVQASNPGDPLVIKYSLRKSLTGEKNDTHKFGYTYIEITPHPTLPDEFRYDYQIFKIGAGLSENDFTSATFNPAAHQDKLMGSGTGVLSSEDAMYRVKVSMKDIPAERGPNVTTQKDESLFYYEKIYFLCVETYPESDIDKKSNFDSMSLSDITKADVPPVRDLKRIEYLETTKGFTEFKFDWVIPAEQLANYFHRTPYKPEDANYNFNVFISQDEAKMKELAKLNKDQLLEYVDGSLSLGGYDTPVTVSYKDYSAIAAGDPEHKGESS